MSQSNVPGPEGLFESIKSAIFNPDSIGEFIFDGLLGGAPFIVIPILTVIKVTAIIFN